MELQSGINVIYGENEAGKSTIHHFIGAMLFGVERLRGKGSKKDEYSRYSRGNRGKITKALWRLPMRGVCIV